jgi:hypothetical protein
MIVTVIGNCQTQVYRNIISAATGLDDVKGVITMTAEANAAEIRTRLDKSDIILSQPISNHELDFLRSESYVEDPRFHIIPNFFLNTFHPDICYIGGQSGRVTGPMGDYHSIIALKAFLSGMSELEAASKFTADTYEKMGYFDQRQTSDDELRHRFASHGIDVDRILNCAYRLGPFMYTVNHPVNTAVAIAVEELMTRIHLPMQNSPTEVAALLPEFLKSAPIWPIYSEIAERFGVAGNILFRSGQNRGYKFMHLAEFVEQSFRVYRSMKTDGILPQGKYAQGKLNSPW